MEEEDNIKCFQKEKDEFIESDEPIAEAAKELYQLSNDETLSENDFSQREIENDKNPDEPKIVYYIRNGTDKLFYLYDTMHYTRLYLVSSFEEARKINDKYKDKIFYQPLEIDFSGSVNENNKNDFLRLATKPSNSKFLSSVRVGKPSGTVFSSHLQLPRIPSSRRGGSRKKHKRKSVKTKKRKHIKRRRTLKKA